MPAEDTIVVLTEKSTEEILAAGGSGSWKVDGARAKKARFIVCTRNRNREGSKAEHPEQHREAFLVGRISDINPDKGRERRIMFSEYAEISVPEVWNGQRYPLHYTSIEALGIDESALTFRPMPVPPIKRKD